VPVILGAISTASWLHASFIGVSRLVAPSMTSGDYMALYARHIAGAIAARSCSSAPGSSACCSARDIRGLRCRNVMLAGGTKFSGTAAVRCSKMQGKALVTQASKLAMQEAPVAGHCGSVAAPHSSREVEQPPTDEDDMPKLNASSALADVRVLDLSRVRAGPTCVRMLADFGADVIRIEPPPGIDPNEAMFAGNRLGGDFQNLNRNKRSLTLNLKKPEGLAVLHRLVKGADVLVENWRPDVKNRLGLDYATLRALNPRIILASISGFGRTGRTPAGRVSTRSSRGWAA
jgi:hypothetical protein